MLQGRELSCRTTRATQKVKEAEPMRSKLKGKGKVKVNDKLFDEAWSEELGISKAKKAAIQAMINQLEG
jgi:post-segregation antitoxin (ccd killing protein)